MEVREVLVKDGVEVRDDKKEVLVKDGVEVRDGKKEDVTKDVEDRGGCAGKD